MHLVIEEVEHTPHLVVAVAVAGSIAAAAVEMAVEASSAGRSLAGGAGWGASGVAGSTVLAW